jgi:zinc transport system substrate-binding protein
VRKLLRVSIFFAALGVLSLSLGCSEKQPVSIVVTTSMLQEAAREVLGDLQEPRVVLLLPPGSCPGHFDLSPRSLPDLRSARVVIRHDYQSMLEEKMERIGAKGARVLSIAAPDSFLIPENYALLARGIAVALWKEFPDHQDVIRANLARVEDRAREWDLTMRERAARRKGMKVIATAMQKQYCAYLGLDVVATVKRPEDVSPREFEDLLKQEAVAVVGNLQEGTQAAESLAKRKGIPVAILSNFPDAEGYGKGYEGLMQANLERLEEAVGR